MIKSLLITKSPDFQALAWPLARLGEALEIVARKENLLPETADTLPPSLSMIPNSPAEQTQWLHYMASHLGLEIEPIEAAYPDVESMLMGAGPALLQLPASLFADGSTPYFLLLLKSGWRWLTVLGADLQIYRLEASTIRAMLCQDIEKPAKQRIQQLLQEAGVAPHRQTQVERSILQEQLNMVQIGHCWLIRLPPNADVWQLSRLANIPHYLAGIIAINILMQLLMLFGWWVIGRGALQGHFEWAWLIAWSLVSLTTIPFQLGMIWAQSMLATEAGVLFKQRLLYGTLQLNPETVRHQGVGQFLGRVMEAEAVEMLALGGGFTAIVALIELMIAAFILTLGAGGWLHALSLLSWTTFTVLTGWRYFSKSEAWVSTYRDMTNDLVERMVGHRTRLAQESRATWHETEDVGLNRYLKLSEKLDHAGLQLSAVIPRGWLISGLAGVSYTFITAPNSPTDIAISIGGVVLASQALTKLVSGLDSIVGFMVAWKQVAPQFQVPPHNSLTHPRALIPHSKTVAVGESIIELRDLVFRYQNRAEAVLQRCRLQIAKGDRLLLEGPSGGGKSTLGSLLVGLRAIDSGLLLLHGLDQQTIGLAAWRKRVIAAPQFHENHVLTETFAFNLLMGRNWPPDPADLAEAEQICRELGLGDLLDRMPAGLQQMVGESGWQLSHGERSRLYIARALLQQADLIVLDESFASLDPENLHQAMACVLKRASTVLVIAHP